MSGKKPYSTIRALYGELEAARREFESEPFDLAWNKRSAGGQAYSLFLELLEIAGWLSSPVEDGDDEDESEDAMGGDSDDLELPHLDGGEAVPQAAGERLPSGTLGVDSSTGLGSTVAVRADELVCDPGVLGDTLAGLKAKGIDPMKLRVKKHGCPPRT